MILFYVRIMNIIDKLAISDKFNALLKEVDNDIFDLFELCCETNQVDVLEYFIQQNFIREYKLHERHLFLFGMRTACGRSKNDSHLKTIQFLFEHYTLNIKELLREELRMLGIRSKVHGGCMEIFYEGNSPEIAKILIKNGFVPPENFDLEWIT